MRVYPSLMFALVLLALVSLTGCNSAESKTGVAAKGASSPAPAQQPAQPVDDIRRMSIAEARAEFDAGKAVIIDVRGEPSYKVGHIKGAQLIPLNEIVAKSSSLPKDKTIILYCSCPAEHSSVAAGEMLKNKDIKNTAALVGGYPAWQAAGYPIEETK